LARVTPLRIFAYFGPGHRQPCFFRQPLDGLREREPFGLHQEGEDVAVLARGEAMVKALDVVDEERRRLLALERREARKFAALLLQRDLATDHLTDRQARPDLVQKLR